MTKIFTKTILREYYRQNLMFFAGMLFFAGSLLRATEHLQIAKLAVQYHQFLVYIMIIWAIYTLKVILFTNRILKERPYEILYQSVLFSRFKRLWALAVLQFNLLGLSVGYSFLYVYVGVQERAWLSVVAVLFFDLLMILIGVLVYEYRLQNPNQAKIFKGFNLKIPTPYALFYIRYLFIKQPILLILTKLFTWFWVFGTIYLYPTDDYDERLLSLGGLFAAIGHVAICQRYFEYEFQQILFIRNLPFSTFQRFLKYILTFGIMLLPEVIILIRHLPTEIHFVYGFYLILFILSIILLVFSILYLNLPDEKFGIRLFWIGLFFFLAIMFRIPIWLMAIANFSIAFYFFNKYYYRAEYVVRKN